MGRAWTKCCRSAGFCKAKLSLGLIATAQGLGVLQTILLGALEFELVGTLYFVVTRTRLFSRYAEAGRRASGARNRIWDVWFR